MAHYFSWVLNSNHIYYVPLAQSVEHLTFNQRVEGSSPSWHTIYDAGVAELADAPDLGSGAVRRGGSSPFTRTILIKCGSSSVVEHHLPKVGVAGSNPVFRSNNAGVAELADAQDLKSCGR